MKYSNFFRYALILALASLLFHCSDSTSSNSKKLRVLLNDAWIADAIDTDLNGYATTANIYFEISTNKPVNLVALVGYRVSGTTSGFTLYKQTESFQLDGDNTYFLGLGDEGQTFPFGCYDFLVQAVNANNFEAIYSEISANQNPNIAAICMEEQTIELEFENPLYTPIDVTVDGYGSFSVDPGVNESIFLTGAPSSVDIIAETAGETTEGDQIGLKMGWDFTSDLSGLEYKGISLGLSSEYFFIFVRNEGTFNLSPFYVNYGTSEETYDNIVIFNDSQDKRIGYYKAFTNTQVRAYRQGTEDYVFWDNSAGNFIPFTENQAVLLLNGNLTLSGKSDLPIMNTNPQSVQNVSKRKSHKLHKADKELMTIFGKEKITQ